MDRKNDLYHMCLQSNSKILLFRNNMLSSTYLLKQI